jgi:hypothetical protein
VAFGGLNLEAWNDGLVACDGQADDLVHQWLSGQFDPLFAAGLQKGWSDDLLHIGNCPKPIVKSTVRCPQRDVDDTVFH